MKNVDRIFNFYQIKGSSFICILFHQTAKFDTHKVSLNETNTAHGNNVTVNITPQWNTERWHRQQHHQQRQQQQLFQHVSASATPLSFPSTTTLNTGICTPLSTTQFYPNNYNVSDDK